MFNVPVIWGEFAPKFWLKIAEEMTEFPIEEEPTGAELGIDNVINDDNSLHSPLNKKNPSLHLVQTLA